MRVQVKQGDLKAGLALVSGAISPRSTLPVLGNILLRAAGGRLRLQATNLELGLTVEIGGVEVEQEGAVTLPARVLGDWVASLPSAIVEMALDEKTQTVALCCAGAKAKVKGIDAKDFPLIPCPEAGPPPATDADAVWHRLALPARLLAAQIERVEYAAAREDSRPTLTGVEVKVSAGRLGLAATDGYRLATAQVSLDTAPDAQLRLVAPRASLRRVGQICGHAPDGQMVQMFIASAPNEAGKEVAHAAVWRLEGEESDDGLGLVEAYTTLIGKDFPDYSAIIPKSHTIRVLVSAAELVDAVKRVAPFSGDFSQDAAVVHLTIDDGLVVSSSGAGVGESESRIACTVDGGPLAMRFNARMLREAAAAVGDVLVGEFTLATRPAVFYPNGAERTQGLAVLMPVTPK